MDTKVLQDLVINKGDDNDTNDTNDTKPKYDWAQADG